MKYLILLIVFCLAACTSPLKREVKLSPEGKHDESADRALCIDYAEKYGVINLGPMMGDKVKNQPDRQRRNVLFVYCMEEKGYGF